MFLKVVNHRWLRGPPNNPRPYVLSISMATVGAGVTTHGFGPHMLPKTGFACSELQRGQMSARLKRLAVTMLGLRSSLGDCRKTRRRNLLTGIYLVEDLLMLKLDRLIYILYFLE